MTLPNPLTDSTAINTQALLAERFRLATPPSSPDDEVQLLASVIMMPERILDAVRLQPGHFYDARLGGIWKAIREVAAGHTAEPTAVEIAEHMRRGMGEEMWSKARGTIVPLLTRIVGEGSVTVRVADCAERLIELAARRATIAAAYEILAEGHESTGDTRAYLTRSQERLAEAAQMADSGKVDTCEQIGDVVRGYLERLARGERPLVLPTGFTDLDRRLDGGFRSTELILLGARPGAGKTAMAIRLAVETARQGDYEDMTEAPGVVIFSAEMARERIALRALAAESHVLGSSLKTAITPDAIGQEGYNRLLQTQQDFSGLPLWIDDRSAPPLTYIKSRLVRVSADAARRQRPDGKPIKTRLVIVDYLQLMGTSKERNKTRETEVAELSRGLKALAKDNDLTVIALSQLNREVETRANKRPVMSDARESGALEQDADIMMFLYRDEYYNKDTTARGICEIILAKQREGSTGRVLVGFDAEYTRFRNLTTSELERAEIAADESARESSPAKRK